MEESNIRRSLRSSATSKPRKYSPTPEEQPSKEKRLVGAKNQPQPNTRATRSSSRKPVEPPAAATSVSTPANGQRMSLIKKWVPPKEDEKKSKEGSSGRSSVVSTTSTQGKQHTRSSVVSTTSSQRNYVGRSSVVSTTSAQREPNGRFSAAPTSQRNSIGRSSLAPTSSSQGNNPLTRSSSRQNAPRKSVQAQPIKMEIKIEESQTTQMLPPQRNRTFHGLVTYETQPRITLEEEIKNIERATKNTVMDPSSSSSMPRHNTRSSKSRQTPSTSTPLRRLALSSIPPRAVLPLPSTAVSNDPPRLSQPSAMISYEPLVLLEHSSPTAANDPPALFEPSTMISNDPHGLTQTLPFVSIAPSVLSATPVMVSNDSISAAKEMFQLSPSLSTCEVTEEPIEDEELSLLIVAEPGKIPTPLALDGQAQLPQDPVKQVEVTAQIPESSFSSRFPIRELRKPKSKDFSPPSSSRLSHSTPVSSTAAAAKSLTRKFAKSSQKNEFLFQNPLDALFEKFSKESTSIVPSPVGIIQKSPVVVNQPQNESTIQEKPMELMDAVKEEQPNEDNIKVDVPVDTKEFDPQVTSMEVDEYDFDSFEPNEVSIPVIQPSNFVIHEATEHHRVEEESGRDRGKSKSVLQLAPSLIPRTPSGKTRKMVPKFSASDTSSLPSIAHLINISADKDEIEAMDTTTTQGNDDKKKRKKRRKSKLLSSKPRKRKPKATPEEVDYEYIIEDGEEEENVTDDKDESDVDCFDECELQEYGENAKEFLCELHPDLSASFDPYEQEDDSYFTRFILFGREKTTPVQIEIEPANGYPSYLKVFEQSALQIIETAQRKLAETGNHLQFPATRFNQQQTFFALRYQFGQNAGSLSEVFIHGISEVHKVVEESKKEKYPLPYFYVKCCEIAKFVGEALVAFPSPSICALHRFCLSYSELHLLCDYLILCRFVNQVVGLSDLFSDINVGLMRELNDIFIENIKHKMADPFYSMKIKFTRHFPLEELVVLTFVCKNADSEEDSPFQRMMTWFNRGFRQMGATVDSCTLNAEWNGEPHMVKASTYCAMSVMQSYLKFIINTYPDKKIVVVNYGEPSMLIYQAIHFVERIWGIINIGFPTYCIQEEIEHVRGGVEDMSLNEAYCPSLFVTGELAEDAEISHYSQILKHYKTKEAGLIIVGDADKTLNVKNDTLLHYRITPACIKRILLEHFYDFIMKCIGKPACPTRFNLPIENKDDPDYEVYLQMKDEVTRMHTELFKKTSNNYDVCVTLGKKIGDKGTSVTNATHLKKDNMIAAEASHQLQRPIEMFSDALSKVQLK